MNRSGIELNDKARLFRAANRDGSRFENNHGLAAVEGERLIVKSAANEKATQSIDRNGPD